MKSFNTLGIFSYMGIMIDEDRFKSLADSMVKNIRRNRRFLSKKPIVLGILNGGKNLADYISEELSLRKEYISIKTRDGKSGNRGIMGIGNWVNVHFPSYLYSDNKFLIVDDILDSGLTMNIAKNLFSNSKIAVLIVKSHDGERISPDYYGEIVQDEWVDFFWEH